MSDKTILGQRDSAYKEAEVVDKIINELLQKYPPTLNQHFWTTYSRTIQSSLDIVILTTNRTKPCNLKF